MWRAKLHIDVPPPLSTCDQRSTGLDTVGHLPTPNASAPGTPYTPLFTLVNSKTLFRGLTFFVEEITTSDGAARSRRLKGDIAWRGGKTADDPTSPAVTHILVFSLSDVRPIGDKPLVLSLGARWPAAAAPTAKPLRTIKQESRTAWDARRLVEEYGEIEARRADAIRPVLRAEWLQACGDAGRLVEQERYRVKGRYPSNDRVQSVEGTSTRQPCRIPTVEARHSQKGVSDIKHTPRTPVDQSSRVQPTTYSSSPSTAPECPSRRDRISAPGGADVATNKAIRAQVLAEEELERQQAKRRVEDEKITEQIRFAQERDRRLARSSIPRKTDTSLAETLFPIDEDDRVRAIRSRDSSPLTEVSSEGSVIDVVLDETAEHDTSRIGASDSAIRPVGLDKAASPTSPMITGGTVQLLPQCPERRKSPSHPTSSPHTRPDACRASAPAPDAGPDRALRPDQFHFDSCPAPGASRSETSTEREIQVEEISPSKVSSSDNVAGRTPFSLPTARSSNAAEARSTSSDAISLERSLQSQPAYTEDSIAVTPGRFHRSTGSLTGDTNLEDESDSLSAGDPATTSPADPNSPVAVSTPASPVDSDDEADFAWLEESATSMIPSAKPVDIISASASTSSLSHIIDQYPTPAPSDGSDNDTTRAERVASRMFIKQESTPGPSTAPAGPPMPFMRNALGLPLSVCVCGDKAPLAKYRLLIEVLSGGHLTDLARAVFVVVHVEREGAEVRLEPEVMDGVTAAMQDPSRAVVTGYWVDHCTNLGQLLDHRQYAMEIVGSQTVKQSRPTPRQPLSRPPTTALIEDPSSQTRTTDQHFAARTSLPTPPPSVVDKPARRPRGRPRKNAPPAISEHSQLRLASPAERPAKKPRPSDPRSSRPRSTSFDSIDTSSSATTASSSSSSFSELRPTLRSDLSSVDGKARNTFLGIEKKGSPPRGRKAKTWEVISREEEIEPEDEMHLHLLADSLNIWIDNHMPGNMGRAQAGWRKGQFLADLAESSPMPDERGSYADLYKKYKPLLYKLVSQFHRLEGKRKQGWKGWALVPVEGDMEAEA